MREIYKISFLPNGFDCFFYLNETNLRQFSIPGSADNCVKIEFAQDLTFFTYSFVSKHYNNLLSNEQIGVNAVYAQLLGFKNGDEVLISKQSAKLLTCVNVTPKNKKDYNLTMKYLQFLENSILNQVRVVALGQTIPIQLQSNIILSMKIESMVPDLPFGQLQPCTEFVVRDPPESPEADFPSPFHTLTSFVEETKSHPLNLISTSSQQHRNFRTDADHMGDILQKKFFSVNTLKSFFTHIWKSCDARSISRIESDNLPKISFAQSNTIYRVNMGFVIENEFPKSVREKFIIVKKLPVLKTVHGPCSYKIFCKVSKVEENLKGVVNRRSALFTYAYVVKLGDTGEDTSDVVYCPDFLLRVLNLRIGSYINMEEAPRKKENMHENRSNSFVLPSRRRLSSDIFTQEMKKIYESAINTIIRNAKFNEKVNTLIVGGMGTGKSYLLNSLMSYFEEKLLFCRKIECKKMRKMKIPTLIKLFDTTLTECCGFQPSILFMDDLDALLIADEEENRYKTLYSERIANLLSSNFSTYQKLNDISIVVTVSSLSKIRCMSTDRGPTMFDNICEISELSATERNKILKNIIVQKYPKSKTSFVDYVTGKTKGYNIQDLYDLVEIAAFKSLARSKSEDYELEKTDFESALSEKVPLSLYGVNLSKNSRTNWDDVGGLEEPKRLLKEMFEWPLRYREIYQSCPLRLQCGVLLYGAPGTGKTLIASAVASECGLNFISVKGPEIFSKYVGASEQGIRDLFMRARKAKPCLLFFDEFDSLAPRRGSSNEDVNDRVVNQILTELDGVEELTEVFILAATSRPDLLDPALLRPGRIDKAIHCGLPEKEERLSILKALSKPLRLSDDVDYEEIASRTSGYTGADLQAVLYAAQTALVKEIDKEYNGEGNDSLKIKRSHLLAGLAETNPSISREEKIRYKSIYENFVASRMGGISERSQEAVQKTMFA